MAGLRTQKRRRKERKTDYKLRLNLLKSNKPRIVVRRSNKYFTVQLAESDHAQDKVLITVTSKDLLKQGLDKKFSGSLKSLPAAYLTGLLFAKKLDNKADYIIDLGMSRTIPKNRIYAVVKGLVDGKANIKADESVFPDEERLSASHLSDEAKQAFNKLKEKIK